MSDETVTVLKIDSDTAGADQYSAAMDKVADSARSATDANSSFSLQVAGVSVGIAAVIAGIKSGIDYIADFNKQLADMASVAKQVGLSLADFQGIQFGGQSSGLSIDQINSGLEKSAQLLNDAQRNENSLSKEFDANSISIRQANGQLITQNQLLGVAADLVSRAKSPGDQLAIAQMLGFTKEWIPLLEQGSAAMASLTEQAQAAGAVIDDSTIKKATQFDEEWRRSSVAFSANLRAALAGLLPYVDDLIARAKEFVKTIDRETVEKAAQGQLNQVGAAAGLDQDGGGLKISITNETIQALDDFKNAPFFSLAFWEAAGRALGSTVQRVSPQALPFETGVDKSYSDTSPSALRAGAVVAASAAEFSGAADSFQKFDNGLGKVISGYSLVASRGKDVNDIFDRAVNTLERHIAKTNADSEAIGGSIGVLEQLRAQAQLVTAAKQAGDDVDDEGISKNTKLQDEIQDLADAAGEAAQKYQEMKASADAAFQLQTAGLSGVDAQIAQIQYRLHGNSWQQFMNDGLSSTLRITSAVKELQADVTGFATNLADGLLSGKSLIDSLTTAAGNLGKKLVDAGLTKLIGEGFGAITSSLGTTSLTSSSEALTASGTSVATAIAAACTTGAEALTAAAGTIAGAGTVAGVGVDVGTSVGGAELVTSGAAAGATLAAGGAAAGAALWGPIAAIGAIAAGVGLSLLSGGGAEKEKKNQEAVQAYNRQQQYAQQAELAGLDTSTISGQLRQFDIQADQQRLQEQEAGGQEMVQLEQSLASQRIAIVQKSVDDSRRTLAALGADSQSDTAQKLAAIQSAASNLTQSLLALGSSTAEVATGVAAAVAKVKTAFDSDLQSKINSANGVGYLNDIQNLLTERTQLLSDSAALGSDPGQVTAYFTAQAQSIVDNAQLTGDAFNDLLKQFPSLTGVVHQFTGSLKDLQTQISQYLAALQTGSLSTLSPTDKLNASAQQFQQILAAVQAGDFTKSSQLTSAADTYLNTAQGYFASSQGYATVFNAVTSALASVAGVPGVSASSNSTLAPIASSVGGTAGSVVPQIAQLVSSNGAANDNSQFFQQQTIALSQVLMQGFNGLGSITQSSIAETNSILRDVLSELKSKRQQPQRPADKAA